MEGEEIFQWKLLRENGSSKKTLIRRSLADAQGQLRSFPWS
jgi:hypothetical protein